MAVVLAVTLCSSIVWLGSKAGAGLDLTDESYSILWIARPSRYRFLYQPFGYGLHPIYMLLGGSIQLLRLFGVGLLVLSGAALGWFAQRFYTSERFTLPLLGALLSLIYYAWVPFTPSYNLLANAGASLCLGGLLGWLSLADRSLSGIASLAVGLGGALLFLGKPPAALVAALCALALVSRKDKPAESLFLAGGACLIPLLAAIEISGSLSGFVAAAVKGTQKLDFGNGLASIPGKLVTDFLHAHPPLLQALAAVLIALFRPGRPAALIAIALATLNVGWAFLVYFDPRYAGEAVLAISWSAMAWCMATRNGWRPLIPIIALNAAPLAIIAGTANDSVQQLSSVMAFPMLALALSAQLMPWRRLVPAAMVVVVVAGLIWGSAHPYSLPAPMGDQVHKLTIREGEFRVDATTKRYVESLQGLARTNGIGPHTPIIDLTGGGPGSAMVLGGYAPAFPWLVQITDNAPRLVDAVWGEMSVAERRSAVILGPVNPRFRSSHLVRSLPKAGLACIGASEPMIFWGVRRRVTLWRLGSNDQCDGAVLLSQP